MENFGDFACQFRGYAFQQHHVGARFLQQFGFFQHFFRAVVAAALDFVAAELVDRLGLQSQVSAHRDTEFG